MNVRTRTRTRTYLIKDLYTQAVYITYSELTLFILFILHIFVTVRCMHYSIYVQYTVITRKQSISYIYTHTLHTITQFTIHNLCIYRKRYIKT
jgi:hypothetical protein